MSNNSRSSTRSDRSVRSNAEEEEVECILCNNVYTDPRVLAPCSHTFCKDCLVQHVRMNGVQGVIQCPDCSNQVKLTPDGVATLPKNRIKIELIRRLKTSNCFQCKAKYNLSICSGHCSRTLCEDCKKIHRKEMELLIQDTAELCRQSLVEKQDDSPDDKFSDADQGLTLEELTKLCNGIEKQIRTIQQDMENMIQSRNEADRQQQTYRAELETALTAGRYLLDKLGNVSENVTKADTGELISNYKECTEKRPRLKSALPKRPEIQTKQSEVTIDHVLEDVEKLEEFRNRVMEGANSRQ